MNQVAIALEVKPERRRAGRMHRGDVGEIAILSGVNERCGRTAASVLDDAQLNIGRVERRKAEPGVVIRIDFRKQQRRVDAAG